MTTLFIVDVLDESVLQCSSSYGFPRVQEGGHQAFPVLLRRFLDVSLHVHLQFGGFPSFDGPLSLLSKALQRLQTKC